jgi:hypothetical protein
VHDDDYLEVSDENLLVINYRHKTAAVTRIFVVFEEPVATE